MTWPRFLPNLPLRSAKGVYLDSPGIPMLALPPTPKRRQKPRAVLQDMGSWFVVSFIAVLLC